MKISKHFEQGIYVLLVLATQTNHTPLKSSTLSELLQVSDSSLKKILRKLVVGDLITSIASKDGGFILNRTITEITLLDVMEAIEGEPLIEFKSTHLAQTIFPNKEHTIQSEQLVLDTLTSATQAYQQQLSSIRLDQLLEVESIVSGAINWQSDGPV